MKVAACRVNSSPESNIIRPGNFQTHQLFLSISLSLSGPAVTTHLAGGETKTKLARSKSVHECRPSFQSTVSSPMTNGDNASGGGKW